jgi:septal ring factor EnvC (AmiA/AmiB activator)
MDDSKRRILIDKLRQDEQRREEGERLRKETERLQEHIERRRKEEAERLRKEQEQRRENEDRFREDMNRYREEEERRQKDQREEEEKSSVLNRPASISRLAGRLGYPFAREFWKSRQPQSGGVVYTYSRYVAYRETRVTRASLPHQNRVLKC